MGWSESYIEDMQREAREALHDGAGLLLEEIKGFRDTLSTYREFVDSCREIEDLLARLERCLNDYRTGE
jgi:hypothetical protein